MARPRSTYPAEIRKERSYRAIFLCPQTQRTLLRWLRRWRIAATDRRDVVQEVLERALRTWATYDPTIAGPRRWLRRIAQRAAADYHRARRRVDEPAEAPDALELADPGPSGQDLVDAMESVCAADPASLRVIVAYDVHGIPMKAIAKDLGIGLSTAYERRSRVIAALQAA